MLFMETHTTRMRD